MKEETIIKRMNDIHTLQCDDGEVILCGTDEDGYEFIICFDAYHFINWINGKNIKYIKEQLINHINKQT